MKSVLDNDIIYKSICYRLGPSVRGLLGETTEDIGALTAARFVLEAKIRRARLQRAPELVLVDLEEMIDATVPIDPSADEQALAASLEWLAQRRGFSLGTGESQLCAVTAGRSLARLATGDKRAIVAMEAILADEPRLERLVGTVICLEQLIRRLLTEGATFTAVQASICQEPSTDVALAICFSCDAGGSSELSAIEGLDSYIRDLRVNAPSVLTP